MPSVQLAFSLVVLITAAVWIDALPLDNVNFAVSTVSAALMWLNLVLYNPLHCSCPFPPLILQLFVGLTSFLICGLFIVINLKKEVDRVLVLIQLVLSVLYWIFWLAAAAATAATVDSVNNSGAWQFASNYDCDYAGVYLNWGGAKGWCEASKRKGAVRACCAFAWLTWALWTASTALLIIEDVIGKNVLSSKPKAAAAAAPTAPAAGTPKNSPPRSRSNSPPTAPQPVQQV